MERPKIQQQFSDLKVRDARPSASPVLLFLWCRRRKVGPASVFR